MQNKQHRRKFITQAGLATAGTLLLSKTGLAQNTTDMTNNSPIKSTSSLGMQWKTQDPFLFCAYHKDSFPGGNENLGPNVNLQGRNIGQDFDNIDGWNMYHGTQVPGFPAHPHSGFETVTIVTEGMVDHSDSLGATGRFGLGDTQWLTSGKGVQHAEMFPLLKEDANPFELFQIWLNLPAKSKMANPYYKMLWKEDIPVINISDKNNNTVTLNLIAGNYKNTKALAPTPDSWAADANNHVQIWTIKMDANAEFVIPADNIEVNRTLYFYQGNSIQIDGDTIENMKMIELYPEKEATIINGNSEGYFLFLQGRPINEPVVQYGPFVANSRAELQETMDKYRKTQFGGWPWASTDPVNEKSKGRFSKLPDGSEVIKES